MKINFSKNLGGTRPNVEAGFTQHNFLTLLFLIGKRRKVLIWKTLKPNQNSAGFTLMELVVSATIFALVSVSLLSLFNYTLQINRRSEALRQVTQGMRSFVETLVKEVRNGQVDYLVVNGTTPYASSIGPCAPPILNPALTPTYASSENRLGIINSEGKEECIYLAYGPGGKQSLGTYVGINHFQADTNPISSTYNPTPVLVIQKSGLQPEILNPANFSVENLMFIIRPLCDPYSIICDGGYQSIQPFVFMNLKFVTKLPTGESVSIFYQTAISTNKYDVPH